MNRISLGTAQFGSKYGVANLGDRVSHDEMCAILKFAISSGVDLIDTAMSYGDSEMRLGMFGVKSFKIISKLPPLPRNCDDVPSWVRCKVNESLLNLRVDHLYGLLLHQPLQLLGDDGAVLYKTLENLRADGYIKKLGISIYTPSDLDALIPRHQFDLVQAPFNVFDRRFYTSGWMQRLKDREIEIHTRSIFLQGLLLMPESDIPKKFWKWRGLWTCWHQWLQARGINALQATLNFPLSFPEVDMMIVGSDTLNQMKEIIEAANTKLDEIIYPDFYCDDENLLNPTSWQYL